MKSKLIKAAQAILVVGMLVSNVYCLVQVRTMQSELEAFMPKIVLHVHALEEWAEEQIAKERTDNL